LTTKKKYLSYGKLIMYIVIFFIVWSIQRLFGRPALLNHFDGLAFELVDSAIKILIWIGFALWMLRRFDSNFWLGLKEMFNNKPPVLVTSIYFVLVGIIALLVSVSVSGNLRISETFSPVMLIAPVLVAGITEELVFRGFILNSLLKKTRKSLAIAIDASLFALIHFPIWIHLGLNLPTILINSAFAIFFSVVLSFSFIKTKSLLVPISLHMFYNLIVTLFNF